MILTNQNADHQLEKDRIKKSLPIRVRKHIVILFAFLIAANAVGLVLLFLTSLIIVEGTMLAQLILPAAFITPLIIISMFFANIYFFFWWWKNIYLIDERRVVHDRGVFWRKRDIVRFPTLDVIEFKQSFLGKIFGFGQILLCNSQTKEEIKLKSIPNPQRYLKIIRALMPKASTFGSAE